MDTSSPSSSHVIPSDPTTNQCQRDHGNRSKHCGISVVMGMAGSADIRHRNMTEKQNLGATPFLSAQLPAVGIPFYECFGFLSLLGFRLTGSKDRKTQIGASRNVTATCEIFRGSRIPVGKYNGTPRQRQLWISSFNAT